MYMIKQKNRKQIHHGQRGFVLVLALVLLAVMTLIGVSSMDNANMELRATANARLHQTAFNASQSLLEYTLSTGALRTDGKKIDYQTADAAVQSANSPSADNTSQASILYAGCSIAPGSSLEEGKGFSYNFYSIQSTGTSANSGKAVSRLAQGTRYPAAACKSL